MNPARAQLKGVDELELLQLIIQQMGEGVVVADQDGRFLIWNRKAESIIGKGMQAAHPRDWPREYGVFDPETKEPFPAERLPLVRALRGEEVDDAELFIRNPRVPEGVYVKVTGRPLKDLMGRLLGGVVVFRDTTEERRVETKLRQLAVIVDSTPDAILGLSPEGRIAEWNPGAARLWGLSPSQARGRSIADLAVESIRDKIREWTMRAAQGASVVGQEAEFADRGGGRFFGALTLAPIRRDGRIIGLSMLVRDVTEQQRLQSMKDQLLAVASHELRAPAAALQMSLELLKEDFENPETARRLLDLALRNAERMTAMLTECLDSERLAAGAETFRREPCDLAALLEEAIELNQPFALRFGVALTGIGLDEPAVALTDPRKFVQAVTNLLTNAAKFSPRGETVIAGIERRGPVLRAYVSDRGPGIPEEFWERIFQRFSRAGSSSRAGVEGAGLGLSITKDIVERLGGHVGYQTKLGRGTTFFIDLEEIEPEAL